MIGATWLGRIAGNVGMSHFRAALLPSYQVDNGNIALWVVAVCNGLEMAYWYRRLGAIMIYYRTAMIG